MITVSNFKIGGFAASNSLAGSMVKVQTQGTVISDDPLFHILMKGVWRLLVRQIQATHPTFTLNEISRFVIVIHKDHTADIHINEIGIIAEMSTKFSVVAGQSIFPSDIVDTRKLRFQDIKFAVDDRVIACIRVEWKFGLYFDLRESQKFDIDLMESSLAHIYRLFNFEVAYLALGNEALLKTLIHAGWFPFIEIIGGDMDRLVTAYKDTFNIEAEENALVEKFTTERIDKISERWKNVPALLSRKDILAPALTAFKARDAVSCMKILLTEIEGVLRDAHVLEKGNSAKLTALFDFAIEKAIAKAGDRNSLFFPTQFLSYLKDYTFANFDPLNPSSTKASRHSVGHGAAPVNLYTQTRALQAILSLDQLAFYL